MFIYRITVKSLNQVYIGLDTKPEYKKSRWKSHCKDAEKSSLRKIHIAMAKYGLDDCVYEVIDRGFTSIGKLALAEIEHIKAHDSYRNGLNSSPGGDGLGKHDLSSMSDDEILVIKRVLGEQFIEYNKKKWSTLNPDERKLKTSHLHNDEVYSKKSDSLKEYYKHNPDSAAERFKAIKNWQKNNHETMIAQNRKNGLLGADATSKKVVVEKEDGSTETYKSISEFQRQTKVWFSTLKDKTLKNEFHKGYKLKGNE